jgi:hypothetical protein
MRFLRIALLVLVLSSLSTGGELRDGKLYVDGKPFYPVGCWMGQSVDLVSRLGMNTAFLVPAATDSGIAAFRQKMRQFGEHGIHMVPYISYGGNGVTPWAPDRLRLTAALATEPNLLAWYVGDDIGPQHFDGIRQTVSILREETPDIPTVADYIEEATQEARTVFTEYIDIRCQYEYPIFQMSMPDYMKWFDAQREFVGDPLWTWTQCFQWGNQVKPVNIGQRNGAGPMPEPDQVRLMSYIAMNRGVRGLLYFSYEELERLPELGAEVALVAAETRMFNDYLAAGEPTYDLTTSEPDFRATAFEYEGSTAIVAAVVRDYYHSWIDEAIITNATIDVPWSGESDPVALLYATPNIVDCEVVHVSSDVVRITIPSFELAGMIMLTANESEVERLRQEIVSVPERLKSFMATGAASQIKKTSGLMFHAGWDGHGNSANPAVYNSSRRVDSCMVATLDGRYDDAVRMWRLALRDARVMTDSLMSFANSHRESIPPQMHKYLRTPYSVRQIDRYMHALDSDEPWHFITEWDLAGPFPLEWDGTWFIRESDGRDLPTLPPGFDRVYGPEADQFGPYETIDGLAGWRGGHTDVEGLLDFVPHFNTTDDVVCYARTNIVAPREMDTTLRLGSNDGVIVWLNGEQILNRNDGRDALPDQDILPVHLVEGANSLLVKVSNLGGWGWKLYFSADDPERELVYRTAVAR